uniref:Ig-like domain-containing protein n=1 Tax=Pelodiscus sinensis TaxID=13735 RepID=K7F866_PELSI
VSDTVVKVRKGQSVKLPCTYSVRQVSDISVMCWGQGMCPISKCSNEIVRTDGWKVTSAQSHRYQLHGAIANGDVSLTISNVGIRDKGMYCCRIEIPGLFNDIKRNLNLKIDPDSCEMLSPPFSISALTTRAPLTTTAPPLTTTAPPLTSMAVLPRPTTPPTTPTSDTTTSATTTTTAPPLAITAALPEPTTAPVTPTSDLPATTPSPTTTIFQSNPASTE